MDDIDVNSIKKFEDGFMTFMAQQKPELLTKIATEKKISDDIKGTLEASITEFKAGFTA